MPVIGSPSVSSEPATHDVTLNGAEWSGVKRWLPRRRLSVFRRLPSSFLVAYNVLSCGEFDFPKPMCRLPPYIYDPDVEKQRIPVARRRVLSRVWWVRGGAPDESSPQESIELNSP